MLIAPFGSGHFGFLAWNFADAVPLGGLDGGWTNVVDLTVSAVARPALVPEPGSALLLALALLALGGTTILRRRRNGRIRS